MKRPRSILIQFSFETELTLEDDPGPPNRPEGEWSAQMAETFADRVRKQMPAVLYDGIRVMGGHVTSYTFNEPAFMTLVDLRDPDDGGDTGGNDGGDDPTVNDDDVDVQRWTTEGGYTFPYDRESPGLQDSRLDA